MAGIVVRAEEHVRAMLEADSGGNSEGGGGRGESKSGNCGDRNIVFVSSPATATAAVAAAAVASTGAPSSCYCSYSCTTAPSTTLAFISAAAVPLLPHGFGQGGEDRH
jgi:hypothetical protein